MIKKKRRVIVFTIIGLILLSVFTVYPFLSKTDAIDSEIMIVEGWVDDYTLLTAANEFSVQNNKFLLTTGGPVSGEDFLMNFNSELKFDIHQKDIEDTSNSTNIKVTAYGNEVDDVFSHFAIAVNDSIIDQAITIDEPNEYGFKIELKQKDIRSVSVIFTNDESTEDGDRNLFVRNVIVNNTTYAPFGKGVSLIFKTNRGTFSEPAYYNYAQKSAFFAAKSGVRKEQIIPVPTRFVERDRTYESALEVKKFIKAKYPKIKRINVVTEGAHARRSWMMYKKAFGADYEIGIIGVDSNEINASNWFTSKKGIEKVAIQFGKYLYAQFIFSPFY